MKKKKFKYLNCYLKGDQIFLPKLCNIFRSAYFTFAIDYI